MAGLTGMLTFFSYGVRAQYQLKFIPVETHTVSLIQTMSLQTSFSSREACIVYIGNLTSILKSKGYLQASLDSVNLGDTVASVQLFLGAVFRLAYVEVSEGDKKIVEQSGCRLNELRDEPFVPGELALLQQKLLDYLENNGYPFAKLRLDSFRFAGEKVSAELVLEKGPHYKIDSIRIYGKVAISSIFLQNYLEIKNGSGYQKRKLQNISKKILDLSFLEEQQPWNITMLGTGSVLNLYLQPKKSSQVNVLIGFLPTNSETLGATKFSVTGDANINLVNVLGNGESIGLNWQQIQVNAPRLNLIYKQPYLFGSSFGISTMFDLLKKDSSYLNINFNLGVQYALTSEQTGRVFIQSFKSTLLTVDTLLIKSSKTLPAQLDLSSINMGVDYEINKTDYRFNPRKGFEFQVTLSAGTRTLHKNNVILKLYDRSFFYGSLYDSIEQKSYQFRLKATGARYFQLGKQSTLKTSLNIGLVQSPSLFRNELFQIGGYKLLRGFNEESIFASQYAVATLEYRYLLSLNSFLFSFVDGGLVKNKTTTPKSNNNYLGAGLGLAFQTKAGIFNISYAIGKKNGSMLDLRQSKIHLGYVNYF